MKLSLKNICFHIFLSGALIATGLVGTAQAVPDPMDRPSLMMLEGKSVRSVLLALTRANKRLIAVGEQGIILLSDDDGKTWRQSQTPVSVTLTDVYFTTSKKGWAVGHSGIVLRSNDSGETWTKQLDGIKAAKMSLDSVNNLIEKKKGDSETLKKAKTAAELLVKDGPDKPFLKIYFSDENTGFIIGAYNLIFRTDDGGDTWKPWQDRLKNVDSLHLYGMSAKGNDIYLAGERGFFLRSSDKGQTFHAIATPYQGTYFGCITVSDGAVLVYGLKGNAYLSKNRGVTWQVIKTVPTSITSGIQLRDGGVVLITEGGEVLLSKDMGCAFQPIKIDHPSPFTDVIETEDGNLLLVGVLGVTRIPGQRNSEAKGDNK